MYNKHNFSSRNIARLQSLIDGIISNPDRSEHFIKMLNSKIVSNNTIVQQFKKLLKNSDYSKEENDQFDDFLFKIQPFFSNLQNLDEPILKLSNNKDSNLRYFIEQLKLAKENQK